MNNLSKVFRFGASVWSLPRRISAEFNKHMSAFGSAINSRFQHVASWSFEQDYRDRHKAIAKENRAKKRITNEKRRAEEKQKREAQAAINVQQRKDAEVATMHKNNQKKIARKIIKELQSRASQASYNYESATLTTKEKRGSALSATFQNDHLKYYTFKRTDITEEDFKMLVGLEPNEAFEDQEGIWRNTPYLKALNQNFLRELLWGIDQDINSNIKRFPNGKKIHSELVVQRRLKRINAMTSKWETHLVLVHVANVKIEDPKLKPRLG